MDNAFIESVVFNIS